jgi:RNA polymerase sigma-70 factor (ECF subfamily)
VELDDIIIGCKNGDTKCQNSLVAMFAARLMALCFRYTKEKELAKDALQDTFISAFKYIHTFEGKGSFEGWLRKIAVNSALKVYGKMYQMHTYEDTLIDVNTYAEVPDVYSHLSIEDILSLLNKLPHAQRVIFNLNVVEGYNHAEIGEMLGITESTSRSALCKARSRIIELLKEEEKVPDHYKKLSFI